MDSRALGDICIDGYRTDGGIVLPDAGQPQADGGVTAATDSGTGVTEPSADAGTVGMTADGGYECSNPNCDIAKIKPGCGCGPSSGFEAFALLVLGALVLRRRH